MTVGRIAVAAKGSLSGVSPEEPITCICTDTRRIEKGCAFVAIKGERFDGHDFIMKAIESGAVCAVSERELEGCPCVIVDDTAKALLNIASDYRNGFDIKLVGVTGSVGKTTTKEMIALALSAGMSTLRTEGNLNNEIGLPITLFRLDSTFRAAVIEMGMSHFGEISRLSACAAPDVCVITNIGFSHIENLGSQEGILKAKLEILEGASADAPLIVNGDDLLLAPLKDSITDRPVLTFATDNPSADFRAVDIKADETSTSFAVVYGSGRTEIKLPCIGAHNILNALAAFAVGTVCGVPAEKISEGLASYRTVGMRQRIERRGGQTLFIDCYNSSPTAAEAAIDMLCSLTPTGKGRRCAVLADMLELGAMSKELHMRVGEYAAKSGIDKLACYGSDAKYIADRAEEFGLHAGFTSDKDMLVEYLRGMLTEGDVVLIKGSRGMRLEEIIDAVWGESDK